MLEKGPDAPSFFFLIHFVPVITVFTNISLKKNVDGKFNESLVVLNTMD